MARLAPAHIDQPRRARRRAADRMDQRKIFCQKIVAGDDGDRGVVPRRELAHRVFEFRRAEVVGGGVDQIARQGHAFDDAIEIAAIDVLRQIETDVARLRLAVAAEAVEAEREGKCREPRIVRLVGEAVDSVRQMLRQPAGQKPVDDFPVAFQPEQHATEALLPGQQQMPPGLGLEARRIGERGGVGAQNLAHIGIRRRRDEPDRNGARHAGRSKDGVHCALFATSTASARRGSRPACRPAGCRPTGWRGQHP